MNRKLVSLAICVALCLCCVAAAEDGSIAVTDMKGRTATFSEPVTRIVALTAADCEILCALGARDMLVGRGEYCNYPADITDVPAVNSGAQTNIEQIIALDPQAVVMNTMAQTLEGVEALEGAGIPVVASVAEDIDGVYAAIEMLGRLTGLDAQAAALISDIRNEFAEIAASAAGGGKTVYFEVSPLEWGLWTAGSNTFMDELATMCGLTNAFSDVEGWAQISEEQVLERDPDYIVTITMYYGQGPTPVDEIMGRAGWENIKAVKNSAVFNADGDEISRPGPRLVNAARALRDFVNAK